MDKEELVDGFPEYRSQVTHIEEIKERGGDLVEPSARLPMELCGDLPFDKLYSHQARALWELEAGGDVCVTTSTSSGKTLIFSLEIARKKYENGDVSALLIYPTKALSRDQKKEIDNLYNEIGMDIDIGVYDGDTSREEKRRIRNNSDIIITNLQGLNHYLPHHRKWKEFFSDMDYIVLDEAHTYTGISGMHAGWIIRRTLRILERAYETSPQLILSSATIGNPREQAKKLTGRDFVVINKDGSPRGRKDIIFWNPPSYTDNEGVYRRRSSHRESAKIVAHLTSKGYQTLCFCKSRKLTELICKWANEFLEENYNTDVTLESYNAGYNKSERREIEEDFKDEEIDGLISTNALEVGINIGSIDCTVLDSFPGSRTSFFQQIGRSGRGDKNSLSVLTLSNSSIDQYINDNPNHLFSEDLEKCVIELENKNVLMNHVLAASNEIPVDKRDFKYFGNELKDVISILSARNLVSGQYLSKGYHYSGGGRPETNVSIYSTTDDNYDIRIIENGEIKKKLPQEDKSRIFRDFYPGAVHLHRGKKYIVDELNKEEKLVKLKPTNVDYTTVSNSEVSISEAKPDEVYSGNGFKIYKGRATVEQNYDTYQKIYEDKRDEKGGFSTGINENIKIRTHAMWIEPPSTSPLMGSLHAAEHCMIKISPTVLKIDSDDIGGLSVSSHEATDGNPTIFIYDGVDGGVGFSHSIYNNIREIMKRATSRMRLCDCESKKGCPACTMSSSCGDDNEPLDRKGAIKLLNNIKDNFK